MPQASRHHAGIKDVLRLVCFVFPRLHGLVCKMDDGGCLLSALTLQYVAFPLTVPYLHFRPYREYDCLFFLIVLVVLKFRKINQENIAERVADPYCTPFCMDALIP